MVILRALFVLFIVLVFGLFAHSIVPDPGLVTFVWKGWEIQLSVILTVTIVLVFSLIMFYLGSFVEWIVELPSILKKRHKLQQDENLFEDLQEVIEGLLVEDSKAFKKREKLSRHPTTCESFAELEVLMGLPVSNEDALNDFAKNVLEINKAYAAKDWRGVVRLADEILEERPKSPKIHRLKLEALLELKEWENALAALDSAIKVDSKLKNRVEEIYLMAGKDLAEDPDKALDIVNQGLKKLGKSSKLTRLKTDLKRLKKTQSNS